MHDSSRIKRDANHSSDQPTSVFALSVTPALAIEFLKLVALQKSVFPSPLFALLIVLLDQRYVFGKNTICSSIAVSLQYSESRACTYLPRARAASTKTTTILLSGTLFLVLHGLVNVVHDFPVDAGIIFLFLIQALPVFALSSLSSSIVEVVFKWI
jgi:hypothetical protein